MIWLAIAAVWLAGAYLTGRLCGVRWGRVWR